MIKSDRVRFEKLPSNRVVSRLFDSTIDLVLGLMNAAPSRKLLHLNDTILEKLNPVNRHVFSGFTRVCKLIETPERRRIVSAVTYKGVAGLIGMNVAAYLLLNSRFMKHRSHVDGLPRVDRHFIASRYNVKQGRVWSVPLSVFNHGDSLFQLAMNCFGLSIVGPAVEVALGPAVLVAGFLFTGSMGAIAEMALGNHWCRGSSAGVTGLFGIGAFASPHQILSIWGMFDVRAASLALNVFGLESVLGLFRSGRSEIAHVAHAAGILSAIPFLYYLRWFR